MKYSTVAAALIAEIASEAVRDRYLVENCDLRPAGDSFFSCNITRAESKVSFYRFEKNV
jgi:hypothetical protein